MPKKAAIRANRQAVEVCEVNHLEGVESKWEILMNHQTGSGIPSPSVVGTRRCTSAGPSVHQNGEQSEQEMDSSCVNYGGKERAETKE